MRTILAALMLALAPSSALATPHYVPQADLAKVASTYVGHAVYVQCSPTLDDWRLEPRARTTDGGLADGFVGVRPGGSFDQTMYLSPGTCAGLRPLVYNYKSAPWVSGRALHTFTHEATHLALNSRDEASVECTAYGNIWRMLKLFPIRDSKRLKAVYYDARIMHRRTPPSYRTVC